MLAKLEEMDKGWKPPEDQRELYEIARTLLAGMLEGSEGDPQRIQTFCRVNDGEFSAKKGRSLRPDLYNRLLKHAQTAAQKEVVARSKSESKPSWLWS